MFRNLVELVAVSTRIMLLLEILLRSAVWELTVRPQRFGKIKQVKEIQNEPVV